MRSNISSDVAAAPMTLSSNLTIIEWQLMHPSPLKILAPRLISSDLGPAGDMEGLDGIASEMKTNAIRNAVIPHAKSQLALVI